MNEITSEEKAKLVKLSLPTNRFITSYAIAEQIVSNACTSHETYWSVIDACNRHIAGEKPLPPDELKKKGMSWVWNFNYGKARAKMEKLTAESSAGVSSAIALAYTTFRNAEKEDSKDKLLYFLADEEKRGMVASAIGAALATTLGRENRLAGWINQVEYPSIGYGYCPLVYDRFDWMPEPIHPLKIAFRPNTKPEKIDQYITFRVMDVSELYDRWITARNEQVKREESEENGVQKRIVSSGWNLAGLESLLAKAYKGKLADNKVAENWQEVIPYYQENASEVMANTESVNIAKIFHRELNGTFTEVYIPWSNSWQKPDQPTQQTTAGEAINNIIFEKNHGPYVQSNHIGLVRDSGFTTESGYIQEYRGILRFAVEDSIRYNRTRNGIGNKMQFVGAPMFEQPTTQTGEKFKVTVSQGFVLLPSSHQMLEKQPNFDINSHIAILGFEEGEYRRDTQQYDASIEGRLTSRPNKGEVQRVSQEVEATNSAKRGIKLRDYSDIFLTVLTRMPSVKCKKTDPGYIGKKRFYDYVKKSLPWLVTKDAEVDRILKCIDSFIMEPVTMNVETITIALQMAETPFGRNRLKRMLLIAKGFPIEEVNLNVPLIQDKFINLQDARVAAIENDMFFTTNEVVLSGSDDDPTHLDAHLAKCGRVIEGVKQGALSPVDAFKYLENNMAHSLQHIEKLGNDPILNGLAEQYMQQYNQVSDVKDQIMVEAQKMLKAQQEQASTPQVDPKTANEIASDNAKAASDKERKDWLAVERARQTEEKIKLSHEQNMRKLELENESRRTS